MKKFLFAVSFLVIYQHSISGQEKIAEIAAPGEFDKTDFSISYYDSLNNNYHINLQSGTTITRFLFDSSFNQIGQYRFVDGNISIKKEKGKKAGFITPLLTSQGSFEVFADKENIYLIKPGFETGKDSLWITHPLKQSGEEEDLVSILAMKENLRILTMPKKGRTMFLYSLAPGKKTEVINFPFPETNFGEAEKKMFSKDVASVIAIKFKPSFNYLLPKETGESYFITPKMVASLYYNEKAIYIPAGMPYSVGVCLIKLDLVDKKLSLSNFFLNDLKSNMNADIFFQYRSISPLVFDSVLLLKNASGRYFSYHFYNVNTGKEIIKYEAEPNDELFELLHSDLNQQGTWLSKKQTKEINNPKTFLRKSVGSNIYVSGRKADSLSVSLISYLYTPGIEGTLLEFSTSMMGYAANIHIGNIQIIPYLYAERDKLIYAHSRFSISSLAPSKARDVSTFLDSLLENVNLKDIAANSSFLIKKNHNYLLGVFDMKSHKFTITSYHE